MKADAMRSSAPRRPASLRLKSERLGQLTIYACAIIMGVVVAKLVLGQLGQNPGVPAQALEDNAAATRTALHRHHAGGGHAAKQQQHAQQQQQQAAAEAGQHSTEEDAWYKKLDVQGCRATENLRVCSHRAKSEELADVHPGSLSAYQALWKAKVKCFDIDFVATSDGALLASHPDDLQRALPGPRFEWLRETVGQHSLEEIREAGADEERYPTLEPVLQMLAKLLDSEEDKWWAKEGAVLDYARLPVILLDLKGPAFSAVSLQRVSAAAEELRITPFVAVFVMGPEQEALAQQAGFKGPLIRGYLDHQDPNPALTAEGVARYAMLGPSINMGDAFFKAAAGLEKPVHAWTVDTPAALHRALEVGVDSVISNRPLALRKVLFDWRDRCSDQL